MAVSVPKRLFKRAVDRNLLKRRIREAYRLNKRELFEYVNGNDLKLILLVQYQHRELTNYHVIEEALVKGLKKLEEKLEARN